MNHSTKLDTNVVNYISTVKNYFLLTCLLAFNTFANGQLTNLQPSVSIYSEYYPNLTTKFKGTIIFENGSGTDISEWKDNRQFFNCAKQIGSVFLYDRNGLGKSTPDLQLSSTNPISAKMISDKLSALLKKRNMKPPYIVVAHSYGAIYAGYFVLQNPAIVSGLLLVDPVPRDFNFSTKLMNKYNKGINEARIHPASYIYKKYGSSKSEVLYQMLGFKESKQSIKYLGQISNKIPIVILSARGMEKEHPLKEDWYTSQKQWLNKNYLSKIIQVSSEHFIQLERPQKVCNELRKISDE